MTDFSLKLNEKTNQLIIATQFNDLSAVKEATLSALFNDSEFSSLYLIPDSIKNFCAEVNDRISKSIVSQPFEAVIAEKKGAKVKFSISNDKMVAKAELTAAFAGKKLAAKHIIKCASQAGITMGLQKEAIEELALAQKEAASGQLFTQDIALGKFPVNGLDSRFESLTESAKERLLRPQKKNNDKVDMRDLGALISVKQGDELMRRHPPTRGKPGFTITGEALQPEPGKKIDFDKAEGSKISESNNDLLIADMSGLPYVLEKGVKVDNVLLLPGVDVASGHIDFEGGVVVSGDVGEGMKLKATGDVTITGFIDNATVEVQGDLTVAGGIVGRKIDEENAKDATMHCQVTASGTVAAKYIQYSEITAGKNIEVISQMIHCRASAEKIIGGEEQRPAAKIVGGHISVGELLSCATIGSPASTHTHIRLFPQHDELAKKLAATSNLIKQKETKMFALKTAWQNIKSMEESDKKNKLMLTTRKEYQKMAVLLKKIQAAEAKINQELTHKLANGKIFASREMFSNVHIQMDNMTINTERDYPSLTVKLQDEKLVKLA